MPKAMKQPGSRTDRDTVFTVRVPRQTHQALRDRAESEHRTLSGHVRYLIERDLAERGTAA